ncbi:MAG: hypothetical protein AAGC60_29190 [Acidobacteriota bacterium]
MSKTARFLPPPLPVLLTLLGLCAVLAAPALAQPPATPPFDRTIIVGGGGTDLANGTALLTAVNDALAAVPPPSSTNPWLIKVEPGIFDLGSQTLQLQSWIDIEGSGRNATFIRSAGTPFGARPSTVNVAPGVDSELRNLTVQFFSNLSGTGIVNASSELKLTQLNVEVETAGSSTGIYSFNSNPRLSAVFPRVASTGGGESTGMLIRGGGPIINEMFFFISSESPRENVGMIVERSADPVIDLVSGVVLGAAQNVGIRVQGASARVTNNRWSVASGETAIGIQVLDSTTVDVAGDLSLKESTVDASLATRVIGLSNQSTQVFVGVKDTIVTAIPAANSTLSVAARNTVNGARTEVDQAVLVGKVSIENAVAGTTIRVGATKLSGVRSIIAGSSAVCVASYDSTYAPIPLGC